MKSKYSYKDIETIVQASNMLIYEHLNYQDIIKKAEKSV